MKMNRSPDSSTMKCGRDLRVWRMRVKGLAPVEGARPGRGVQAFRLIYMVG